jgi:hypothetical protein
VTLRRLRSGELLAGAGAVALLVLLFLDWFGPEPRPSGARPSAESPVGAPLVDATSGWASLGWLLVLLIVVVLLLAAWLVVATVIDAPVSQQIAAAVLTASAGAIMLALVAIRLAVAQPGLGAGLPDQSVAVDLPAYLGLLALGLVVAGAWRAIADERTDAPESASTPPPARPAPPERI